MTIQALSNTYSSPTKQFVTEAEYWEKYYEYPDIIYEWNNGYLEEKPVSDYLTFLSYSWFWKLLDYYLATKPIAKTVGLEMGFSLILIHKTLTRRPDLGIVLNTNKVQLLPADKSYKGTFDLCVEAVSDSKKADIKRDTEDKFKEYAQAGVKEYYILDGHNRYTGFYRLETNGIYRPIAVQKGIIKSTVLPGFQFRFKDLYHCPTFAEMTKDQVYKDFILPEYTEALEKIEEVTQQVNMESLARKKAEQLAKKFAEQLRALGVDVDDI